MDLIKCKENLKDKLIKYRSALLVILLGFLLMTMPGKREKSRQSAPVQPPADFQQSLEAILSSIEGAGKVRLLLSEEIGETTIYQNNEDRQGQGGGLKRETVVLMDAQRSQYGLVRQIAAPKYRGAVVLAQGADRPQVKLAIINAVSKAAGIGTSKISVHKME